MACDRGVMRNSPDNGYIVPASLNVERKIISPSKN